MNQDDIMRLAREAGFEHIAEADYWHPYFARFAALAYAAGAAAGAEAEREARAKACDEASRPIYIAEVTMPDPDEHNQVYPWFIASEIRARGDK